MVKCLLNWQFESRHDDPEWGSLSYDKFVELPFMPRAGDRLTIMECSPVKVIDAEFDVDEGYARVILSSWENFLSRTWEEINSRFVADGWTFAENDGKAPSFKLNGESVS